MRNRMLGLILAVVPLLVLSPVMLAQTTGQSGAARATPDLSGVWDRAPGGGHGFTVMPEVLPMQPWAAEYYKAAREGASNPLMAGRDDMNPSFNCFPHGIPRILTVSPRPMEIVQTPGRVLMLFEADHWVRHIWTDGRGHPKDLADREPTYMGDSIGRWDGDTLVFDTIGFKDNLWLDGLGHPHTDALHVVERIRRVDHNTLDDELTINDPKAYTKPWTAKQVFKLKPDWIIAEHVVCEEHLLNEHLPRMVRGPRP